MMADIMADSQTETVLAQLDRGEADDKTRDRVSAAILRSQTKLVAQIGEIRENLWTLDRLEQLVDRRHQNLCAQCVLRKPAEQAPAQQKRSFADALLSSESLRYFILILILVWAVIYVKTGPEGAKAVKDAALSTAAGGAR